jgi:hypothetical protein
MSSNPQIAIEDDEIAALLDELEAETGGATSAPVKPAAKKAEPEPVAVAEPEPEPELEPAETEPEPEPEPVKAKAVRTPKPDPVAAPAPAAADFTDVADAVELSEDVPQTAQAKLQYFVDVNQFNRDTKLTEATLDGAMMEQASLRAYYGTLAANAEAQHARLKVRFDVLEAKLYDEIRKSLAAGGEKVTEKMVENGVKLDPRWLKAKNAVIEADTIAAINKGLVASLGDRRDMMIQMGADRREGYKGAMRVMEAKNEAENLGARAKAAFQNARPQ